MGISIVTTVTAAAVSYDLTDLATVKDDLSIGVQQPDTANDTWLGRAITQLSKAAQKYTKQPLVVEALTDTIDIEQDPYPYQTPGGVAPLQLSRFPIVSIGQVLQTIALSTTRNLVQNTDFRVDYKNGQLIRLNPFTGVATTWEALPLIAPYVSGLGAVVTETDMIPVSPYQVTVANAAELSIDQGVVYASSGTALVAVASNPSAGQYAVNTETGVYTFAAADSGQSVKITYGYNDIEDDVIEAVLRLVTMRFRARGRDPMQMSRSTAELGEQRFWVNGVAFPPEIQNLLDLYRVPSLA